MSTVCYKLWLFNVRMNLTSRFKPGIRSQEFEMCPHQTKTIYIPSINFVTLNLEEIVLKVYLQFPAIILWKPSIYQ